MTDALNPCPFCGGKAALHEPEGAGRGYEFPFIYCTICNAQGTDCKHGSDEAVKAWNTVFLREIRLHSGSEENPIPNEKEIRDIVLAAAKSVPTSAEYPESARVDAIVRAIAPHLKQEAPVNEHQTETIRCMSAVFDDLALALGLEPHEYGDPDLLFDAIDKLKAPKRELFGEWQTFETVPRDGSSVFLYRPGAEECHQPAVVLDAFHPVYKYFGQCNDAMLKPTHWMPFNGPKVPHPPEI